MLYDVRSMTLDYLKHYRGHCTLDWILHPSVLGHKHTAIIYLCKTDNCLSLSLSNFSIVVE